MCIFLSVIRCIYLIIKWLWDCRSMLLVQINEPVILTVLIDKHEVFGLFDSSSLHYSFHRVA